MTNKIMGIIRLPRILFFLSLTLTFMTVSCAETKVSQCQKIIVTTKKIAQESEKNRQTKDLQQVLQVADAFEEAAKTMKNLKIKDKQLAQYQQGFAEVYQGNAKATREFISALEKKDIPAAQSLQKQVQAIGQMEQKLVNEMNIYCQTK